ncbi:MerR family transcriptional regulator [Effusibacillus lacus]|uniref:HTH merR-type domain-containing protein n=1 Tax=Effusibacillus lacus TaxID=1348429 RepID=A0A292YPH0_9BACL|nr:MerR family transcriptional regulator [Effusibacillus lacus]TCS68153.1 DNA-binding transcriptional MerR regulator [Effusibacillus lacus]GAX90284.1 hypothetical protein EFBL_1910 [Effusibacillus lacus]
MYRIGELADLTNLSKRTIDYYTQLGLLTPERTESNYRYYSEEALERLKLIELYKKEKLSLEEIRERIQLLDSLGNNSRAVCQRVHELSEQLLELEKQLLELKPLFQGLDKKQQQLLTSRISVQGMSLLHTLAFIIGETPL